MCGSVQGVTEDAIARLFRRFPGMEYCDLKKERATGKSKVCVSSLQVHTGTHAAVYDDRGHWTAQP